MAPRSVPATTPGALYRVCLGIPGGPACGVLVGYPRNRCPLHRRGYYRRESAKRGGIYSGGWRGRARAQVAAHPYCAWCGTTTDLTADHVYPRMGASPLQTLCRACNSAKSNAQRKWLG